MLAVTDIAIITNGEDGNSGTGTRIHTGINGTGIQVGRLIHLLTVIIIGEIIVTTGTIIIIGPTIIMAVVTIIGTIMTIIITTIIQTDHILEAEDLV